MSIQDETYEAWRKKHPTWPHTEVDAREEWAFQMAERAKQRAWREQKKREGAEILEGGDVKP